jgi:hypothetical protein
MIADMRYTIVMGMEMTGGKVGVRNARYCSGRRGRSTHVDICMPLNGFSKPFVLILQ